jgi:murein L,D-transpeptidase YafK
VYSEKGVTVNKNIAYKKIKLYERNGDKNYRKIAIKMKCKWENKVGKMQRLLEATEE